MMNILVVDDDDISRAKIVHLLSDYGICVEAEDGQDALCHFGKAFGSGTPFDFITMDIGMPGLDGYDVVKAIRRWEQAHAPKTYSPVKIVMLTSQRDMNSIYTSHGHHCDHYIVKPVTSVNMHECMRKLNCIETGLPVASESCPAHPDEANEFDTLKVKVGKLIGQLEEKTLIIQDLERKCQQADIEKEEFMLTISHELRTPLSGVLGMADLLFETDLNDLQTSFAQTIRESGHAMLQLVEELIDMASIRSCQCYLAPFAFSLPQQLKPFHEAMEQEAKTKGLVYTHEMDPAIPDEFFGDARRLLQVITILVKNAIKFTAAGSVAIKGTLQEETQHHAMLRFTVKDTGVGIAPADQKKIFKAFSQLDGSMTRAFGGTGVGLSIAHSLASFMGGGIYVKSQLGAGSTFSFTVCLQKADTPDAEVLTHPDSTGYVVRSLVISPDMSLCHVMGTACRGWGLRCQTTDDVSSAFDQITSACELGDPFKIIVLDEAIKTQLGGIALSEATAKDQEQNHTQIFWLRTAADSDGSVTEGSSQTILKPIQFEDVHSKLKSVLNITPAAYGSTPFLS